MLAERRLVTVSKDKIYVLEEQMPDSCTPQDKSPQPPMQPGGHQEKKVKDQQGNQKMPNEKGKNDEDPRPDWVY